jgi:hypothetical protein
VDTQKTYRQDCEAFGAGRLVRFSEEAATAKSSAAELLAKHDIAMCELKAGEAFTKEMGIGLKFNADHSWHSKGSKGYDIELLRAVAKINGVAMFAGRWESHDFAGKPKDLEAFKYMREIVLAQREAGLASYCLETGNRDRSAWFVGFALGVAEVVRDLMKASAVKQKEWGIDSSGPQRITLGAMRRSRPHELRPQQSSFCGPPVNVSMPAGRFPTPREQRGKVGDGVIGDPVEHIGKPSLGIDTVQHRRLNQRVHIPTCSNCN